MIKFYTTKDEHGYMSNFYRAEIRTEEDGVFPTSEHFYQALKAQNYDDFCAIATAPTPKEAARLGRSVELKQDWEKVKYGAMLDALMFKFTQHPDLAKKLVATWPEMLVEDTVNTPRPDEVWGNGANGDGLNALGHLLMFVRQVLRKKEQDANSGS